MGECVLTLYCAEVKVHPGFYVADSSQLGSVVKEANMGKMDRELMMTVSDFAQLYDVSYISQSYPDKGGWTRLYLSGVTEGYCVCSLLHYCFSLHGLKISSKILELVLSIPTILTPKASTA